MRTEIKMRFNMGYLHGKEERRLQLIDSDTASLGGLMNHLSGIMPSPEEFGVNQITFDSLNTNPMWFCTENEDTMTYGMQLCMTIHHEAPLSLAAARAIIDAVYENGANASYTPDSGDTYPYTFMYPYHTIHDLGDEEAPAPAPAPEPEYEIVLDSEEEDCDVYTPCPPRRPTKYNCMNCSPAFATSDGEYPAMVVDVCYKCERCGRTVSHSIDNPTVCKRCF
jgi:hypothetical protein